MINQLYSTRKSGLAQMIQTLISLLPVSLKWLVAVGKADLLGNFKQAYTKLI